MTKKSPHGTPSSPFQLPRLPASLSDSLTTGTSVPPPPSSSPSGNDFKVTTSPQLSRPYRTTSSDIISPASTSSMPGTFPSSPLASPYPQPETPSRLPRNDYMSSSPPPLSSASTISSTQTRRPSLRSILSLKTLKRSYNNRSSDSLASTSSPLRPDSPSGSSTVSSPRPSLGKKKSGTFWARRKSSLSMGVMDTGNNHVLDLLEGDDEAVEPEKENRRPLMEAEKVERAPSPPPRLPEIKRLGTGFQGANGEFLGAEDIFKDIK